MVVSCGVGHNKRIVPTYSLRVVKGDYKGRGEGTGNPLLLYKFPQRQRKRGGIAGRLTSPQTLVVVSFVLSATPQTGGNGQGI